MELSGPHPCPPEDGGELLTSLASRDILPSLQEIWKVPATRHWGHVGFKLGGLIWSTRGEPRADPQANSQLAPQPWG